MNEAVQRKGLGKFLMQLVELIARKNNMVYVFLTVFTGTLFLDMTDDVGSVVVV